MTAAGASCAWPTRREVGAHTRRDGGSLPKEKASMAPLGNWLAAARATRGGCPGSPWNAQRCACVCSRPSRVLVVQRSAVENCRGEWRPRRWAAGEFDSRDDGGYEVISDIPSSIGEMEMVGLGLAGGYKVHFLIQRAATPLAGSFPRVSSWHLRPAGASTKDAQTATKGPPSLPPATGLHDPLAAHDIKCNLVQVTSHKHNQHKDLRHLVERHRTVAGSADHPAQDPMPGWFRSMDPEYHPRVRLSEYSSNQSPVESHSDAPCVRSPAD
ncbi:hypothetical protein PCL_12179 [Purpureocillium lilacinum]|uniref:Uncharacterized protein n=1 Tax=Purpureocillium lilacinum TaxID=33203 RepID=A0A2U3E8G7_PURLI|nr:hypothetical protein PCL_12179 [Purpureocillium lilacinum]